MPVRKGAVTLSDVAAAARVSKATASNVFSRPERVRPVLRERVEAAAKALDYAGPDPRGQALSSGRVNAIGVVPSAAWGISIFLTDPYQKLFLTGVTEVCEQQGVGVSLVSGRANEQAWGIKSALVDGFILNSADQVAFIPPARKHIPIVVVNALVGPEVSSVRIADRDGGRLAAEHLLALGHRRFVVASVLHEFRPPVFHSAGANRSLVAPFTAMVERLAGIDGAPRRRSFARYDADRRGLRHARGRARLRQRAGADPGPGGGRDRRDRSRRQARLSILSEARARGIDIPRDLSIVGFDDIPAASVSDPPLTTVNHDPVEGGRTAARLLLAGGPPQQVILPVKLVVRSSTGAPGRA